MSSVRCPLAKSWMRLIKQAGCPMMGLKSLVASLLTNRKAILIDSGSRKSPPVVSGIRATLLLVGVHVDRLLGKNCTSLRAMT